MVSAVKLVTYFKKTELNNKFEMALKQNNDSRWNSTLTMLQSMLDHKDGVIDVLKQWFSNFFQCDAFKKSLRDFAMHQTAS